MNDRLNAMLHAVDSAKEVILSSKSTVAEEKDDSYVGHHAIVTKADFSSQETILSELSSTFSDARFITEEEEIKPNVLNEENYKEFISGEQNLSFVVDPLDGTSSQNRGLSEWSISIGSMQGMGHMEGVISSPHVLGGLLVYGGKGEGIVVEEGLRTSEGFIAGDKEDKENIIFYGVDIPLYEEFDTFMHNIANNLSRTVNTTGSCALGLAYLVAGKADAVIMPPQGSWDWAGGYALIKELGGKFQFYKIDEDKDGKIDYANGKLEIVNKLKPEHYHPDKRNLAFIAGNPTLVERLTDKLINLYRK